MKFPSEKLQQRNSLNICLTKIIALKQQRFAADFSQRIGKTVPIVQTGWMAAFAVHAVCQTSRCYLLYSDRFNLDLRNADQFI